MIATVFLVACASPAVEKSQTASIARERPQITYKRSKTEAPRKAIPFQEFGVLEGQQLRLTLNDTLADQQTYEQCDQKPVEVSPPWRMPRCESMGIGGCRVYESVPGQKPPACKVPGPFGSCFASETPKPPPREVRMTTDCYKAQADADVLGRIGIYAVPEDTPRSETASRGRRIASVALRPGGSQVVAIPLQAVSGNECLALVDTRGSVISLRGSDNGPNSHLFATPPMIERSIRDLQKTAGQSQQDVIETLKQDIDKYVRSLKANTAWSGQRCVEPMMERLPPDYKGMSDEEIEYEAKGYCAAMLSTMIGQNELLSAIEASQEFDYRSAGFKLGMDPAYAPSCTRKSHFYNPADIDRINMETGRVAPGGSGRSASGGVGRNELILAMLRQCTADAVNVCSAPKRQWALEVQRIKEAPGLAMNSCESDFQALRTAVVSLQRAELEASLAKPSSRPVPTRSKPERPRKLALSAAMCGKVQPK